MAEVLSARAAVDRIPSGATVCIGGTGVAQEPTAVLDALEERFVETSSPGDLTIVAPMCPGDRPGVGGLNCIAHEGMLRKLIGSSFNRKRHPGLLDMVGDGRCEGYTVGMGALVQLMNAIGAGRPGLHTTSGIGTFLDPRIEGGRMNDRSTDVPGRVEVVDGVEHIFYPSFPIDVAVIRATTADERGYLSMEGEPNSLAMLDYALAAKNSGGMVIAQVQRLAAAGTLDARLVRIPGPLVDAIVVDPYQTQLSTTMADPLEGYNPFLAGGMRRPLHDLPPVPDGSARLILRRAAMELREGDVVNVGAGVATDLPRILLEEGAHDRVVFTNEHGVFGGLMGTALGGSFVPALNADALMDSAFQFDYYAGGGLDITFLGIGQVDRTGNVNVSRFANVWNGPGGFTEITDRTPRIVHCGTLTSGGLDVRVEDGELRIVREGSHRKFVESVQQITLSSEQARRKGQHVRYVTERAVFDIDPDGIVVSEVAPGIDVERDVIAQMGFEPAVAEDLRTTPVAVLTGDPLPLESHLRRDRGVQP